MTLSDTTTFLTGLSSFWNRLFSDVDLLNESYAAHEETVAQAYLDLMESVLSSALDEVPVFHRDNWRYISVREDNVFYEPSGNVNFKVDVGDARAVPFLYNRILDPTAVLEDGVDYDVTATLNYNETDQTNHIGFYSNPFISGTNGGPVDGVPFRTVTLDTPTIHKSAVDGRTGIDPSEPLSTTSSFYTPQANGSGTDVYKFSSVDVGRTLVLVSSLSEDEYTIDTVEDVDHVTLIDPDTGAAPTFTFETGLSWRVESSVVKELAFWAPQVLSDKKLIQDNFGYLINRFEPTSEDYKSLVKGIFQYFLLGPSMLRIESALNVITGVPVASADGEILTGFTAAFTPTKDRITTNLGTYDVPLNAARADVQDAANFDVLTFQAFEPLTEIFDVKDYVTDPTWWWNITIPHQLMPTESFNRRTVTPLLYDFVYDDPDDEALYDDLGIAYGADDDGTLVPSGMGRPGLHHKHSYHAMDKYIKRHMFGVFIDSNFTLPRTQEDLIDIIDAGKPSYTYMYFEPTVDYTETVSVTDEIAAIAIGIGMAFSIVGSGIGSGVGGDSSLYESLDRISNELMVGSPAVIPSYYYYSGSGIVVLTGTGDPSLGETQVSIGGDDPWTLISGMGEGYLDWPVQITVT